MHTSARSRPGFTLVELFIVLGVLVVLALFLFPLYVQYFPRRGCGNRQSSCANNVRQMTLAIAMNYEDNGQVFPDRDKFWSTLSFLPKTLRCATYGNTQGNAYGYNGNLGGRAITDPGLPEVQLIPVMSEMAGNGNVLSTSLDIDFRHTGKANVGYADGHVALTPPSGIAILPSFTDSTEFLTASYEMPRRRGGDPPTTWRKTGAGSGAWRRLCAATTGAAHAGYAKPLGAGWRSNYAAHMANGNPAQTDGYWSGMSIACPTALCLVGNDAGYPSNLVSTYRGATPYLRIPLNVASPGAAAPSSSNGHWSVSIPCLLFQGMGRTATATACLRPSNRRHPPFASVAVLDTACQPIGVFTCTLNDGMLAYTFNGQTVVRKTATPYKSAYCLNRWCTTDETWGRDANGGQWHWLAIMQADGKLICHFGTPNNPMLGGTVGVAAPGAAAPAWLEIRVKTNQPGEETGCGGVAILTTHAGGGAYYNTNAPKAPVPAP